MTDLSMSNLSSQLLSICDECSIVTISDYLRRQYICHKKSMLIRNDLPLQIMTICDDRLIIIGIYIYLRRACIATGSYKLYVVANNQLFCDKWLFSLQSIFCDVVLGILWQSALSQKGQFVLVILTYPLQVPRKIRAWELGCPALSWILFVFFMLDECYDPRHVGEHLWMTVNLAFTLLPLDLKLWTAF